MMFLLHNDNKNDNKRKIYNNITLQASKLHECVLSPAKKIDVTIVYLAEALLRCKPHTTLVENQSLTKKILSYQNK